MSSVSTATTPNYACSYVSESSRVNNSVQLFNTNSKLLIEATIQELFTTVIEVKPYIDRAKATHNAEALNRSKLISFQGCINIFLTYKIKQAGAVIGCISYSGQIEKYKKISSDNNELAENLINHTAICLKKAVDDAAAGPDENIRRIRSSITEMASYNLDGSKLVAKDKESLIELQTRVKDLYIAMSNSIFAYFVVEHEKFNIYSL